MRERGLKRDAFADGLVLGASLPVRERGLKLD